VTALLHALQQMRPGDKGSLQQQLAIISTDCNLSAGGAFTAVETAHRKYATALPTGSAVRELLYTFGPERQERLESAVDKHLQSNSMTEKDLSMSVLKVCVEKLETQEQQVAVRRQQQQLSAQQNAQLPRGAAAFSQPQRQQQPQQPQQQRQGQWQQHNQQQRWWNRDTGGQ